MKRGCSVFETGHTVRSCRGQLPGCTGYDVPSSRRLPLSFIPHMPLAYSQVVLAWCESSRDIAQLTRVLTQLCAANRGTGGGVVVVLTQHVILVCLCWGEGE